MNPQVWAPKLQAAGEEGVLGPGLGGVQSSHPPCPRFIPFSGSVC